MRRSDITFVVCIMKKKGSEIVDSKYSVSLDQIIPHVLLIIMQMLL